MKEQALEEIQLPLADLFQDIFDQYDDELKKDRTTKNPFFRELRERITKTFSPALKLTDLEAHALGGVGLMRTNPYITFLAPGHRTSKGIYPGYLISIDTKELVLGIGHANDNPPPVELAEDLVELAATLLPEFKERNDQGYPQKRYSTSGLLDDVLNRDLTACFRAHRQCLNQLNEEIDDYLEADEEAPRASHRTSQHPNETQLQELIDAFLEWYDRDPEFQAVRAPVPEYQKFSKEFFSKLTDTELVDVFYRFAQEGGKIQSGGERTAGRLRDSIAANPQGFRKLIVSIFDKDFDLESWWDGCEDFLGFGRGVRSIFLYRLFPDRFVPFNTKAVDGYRQLGLHPARRPTHSFDYGLVIDAARKLVALRPERLDLGKADAMTQFLIGTPEGEESFREVMGIHDAAKGAEGTEPSRRYWLLASGPSGKFADDFLSTQSISIGFGFFEDLTEYPDLELIRKRIVEKTGEEASHKHIALGLFEFAHEMKPGDVVFLKAGVRKLIGVGIVSSDYRYEGNPRVANHCHARDIQWIKTGSWQFQGDDRRLVTKTLTDITPYRQQLADLRSLMGLDEISLDTPLIAKQTLQAEPYTKLDALETLFMSEARLDALLSALRYNKNIVLQGPPGVGKTFVAKRLAYCLIGRKADAQIQTVQFHQSYAYEDFVQGIRPNDHGKFEVRDGIFYRFCKQAIADPTNTYVFIVDEINRGNLSKIFGELMMLIEPDKRGRDHAIPLTYSGESDELFFVPENLHVIGTMNTADRSLALVDYALRRRFYFMTLEPEFNSPRFRETLDNIGIPRSMIDKIISRLNALNDRIARDDKDLGRGYRLGHSFFCPRSLNGSSENDWYEQVVRMCLEPLLQEYWFDDEAKAAAEIESLLA